MRRIEIDKDELKALVLSGASRPEIAAKLNCSTRTIANRIKEWGFLNLTPNNKANPIINDSKKCNICNKTKSISRFSAHSRKLNGLRSSCKDCDAQHYENNKKEIREQHKRNYNENKDAYYARYANRRAYKLNATPIWYSELDGFILQEMYKLNKHREELFGIKYHIDHIIPLKGEQVCGLHYYKNWQILTASENFKKGNKYYV